MTANTDVVEPSSVSKYQYKALLSMLRVLPMILACCGCINTYLSFFGYESHILSYIGGISFTGWLFVYLSAIVFKFCIYHRMFLYYVLVNNLLSVYKLEYGIPLSDAAFIRVYSFITGIFLFLILFYYRREKLCCKRSKKHSN